MIKHKLGKKEYINIKDVFEKEDKDFTPWLSENLNILGEQLNLEIIDPSIENEVGDFYCDIVAHEERTNRIIIIENQYEYTDHDHLGKIITYASGKNASIIIWISEYFREEHKKALEWLNENTDAESAISFFGIEIKLLKIDNSPIAPDFNIVVKPNDWERNIKLSKITLSESNKKYLDFFSKLINEYSKACPKWNKIKPLPQSWINFGAGKSGISYAWAFKGNNKLGVELYIDVGDKTINEDIFDKLYKHNTKIQEELKNYNLIWEKLPAKRASRIAIIKDNPSNIKGLNENDVNEIIKWAVEAMQKFISIISIYLKNI